MGGVRRADAELLQKIGEGDGPQDAVEDEAHGAVFRVGDHVDDGARETRVTHGRHCDQQLSSQRGHRFADNHVTPPFLAQAIYFRDVSPYRECPFSLAPFYIGLYGRI